MQGDVTESGQTGIAVTLGFRPCNKLSSNPLWLSDNF